MEHPVRYLLHFLLTVTLKRTIETRASFRVRSTIWVGHSLRNRQYVVSFNGSPFNWIRCSNDRWMDAIRFQLLIFQLFVQRHDEFTSFHHMEIGKFASIRIKKKGAKDLMFKHVTEKNVVVNGGWSQSIITVFCVAYLFLVSFCHQFIRNRFSILVHHFFFFFVSMCWSNTFLRLR